MTAAAEALQQERPRLFSLAYRMLGSAGEAEDMVQEAYLRWFAQPQTGIESPPAWLTTVVTRLCLDELKSARRRREQYPGVWLPEPVLLPENEAGEAADPQEHLHRLESVSLAFLVLLESLSPLERAVYLLAEVFDHSHAEVAAIVNRTPQACRQALRRARLALDPPKPPPAPAEKHRELLATFLAACRRGDIEALTQLLAGDVVSRADGGGFTTAATRPVTGVRAVSRLFTGLSRQMPADLQVQIEDVNGWPAAVMSLGGVVVSVLQLRASEGGIHTIDNVLNPVKLQRVAAALGLKTAAG